MIRKCEYTGDELRDDGIRLYHTDDSPCFGKSGRIVQMITPPPGLCAVYWTGTVDAPDVFRQRVIAVVLMELCDGSREVKVMDGVDCSWEPCDSADNFLGIMFETESLAPWKEAALERLTKRAKEAERLPAASKSKDP